MSLVTRLACAGAVVLAVGAVGCSDDGDTSDTGSGGSGSGGSGSGGGAAACDVCDAPPDSAGMYALLTGGDYTGWDKESAAHASTGPHGSSVLTYLSPILSASLGQSNATHDRGSAVVKELLDGGGMVTGWAAWVKTQDDSADGDNIYWYENFSTTSNNPVADGFGPPGCTNCHAGGTDYLQIPYPLQ